MQNKHSENSVAWRPCMDAQTAQKRMDLINAIRSFFRQRNVLEVDTPILSHASALDPHIDVYQSRFQMDATQSIGEDRFLSTSPEFHMKRLLAAGYPDIFQLGKAFRNGESGQKHLGEFTILEWYRKDWDTKKLMQEVWEVCAEVFKTAGKDSLAKYKVTSYREAFQKWVSMDPFHWDLDDFADICAQNDLPSFRIESHDEGLNYLLGLLIEPNLGKECPEFLVDYPASQAALARRFVDSVGNQVAARFELYINGVELCNGYHELVDPVEQRQRFMEDQKMRQAMKKPTLKMDENFLSALESGLPECSGVALGVDRLIMLAMDKVSILDTVSFGDQNC